MMENQGYKLEHCRKHCTKSAQDWTELYEELEKTLIELNLPSTLEKIFQTVHYHHIPKIAVAGCPNGCSHPQIKDIGISGYLRPLMTEEVCSGCQVCIDSCFENALSWQEDEIVLNAEQCLDCGDCIRACPTGRIAPGESGWIIRLGGRLGRHPQLAKISGTEKTSADVVRRIEELFKNYIENAQPHERLNRFLDRQSE